MVLKTPQKPVCHRCHDVQSAHQIRNDSHLTHCRELVEITGSVIITIGSTVQYPWVWNSALPQSDNPCKYLLLFIQYPQIQSYYRIIYFCEIETCPAQFGCSCKPRGIWVISEFELHFCTLIVAHFCIHADNIRMMCKTVCEPPLQLMNLDWQRRKQYRLLRRRCRRKVAIITLRLVQNGLS